MTLFTSTNTPTRTPIAMVAICPIQHHYTPCRPPPRRLVTHRGPSASAPLPLPCLRPRRASFRVPPYERNSQVRVIAEHWRLGRTLKTQMEVQNHVGWPQCESRPRRRHLLCAAANPSGRGRDRVSSPCRRLARARRQKFQSHLIIEEKALAQNPCTIGL